MLVSWSFDKNVIFIYIDIMLWHHSFGNQDIVKHYFTLHDLTDAFVKSDLL